MRLDGDDIYSPALRITQVRKRIGMVFQKPNPCAIRTVVSPFGQGGIIGATMLALGRALVRSAGSLRHLGFFTSGMSGVRPTDPLTRGGVLHAMVGSIIEIEIAVTITVPLGIGTAVYMSEVGGRLARVVRTVVEAMTALPSIVAGLFIYTVLTASARNPALNFRGQLAAHGVGRRSHDRGGVPAPAARRGGARDCTQDEALARQARLNQH